MIAALTFSPGRLLVVVLVFAGMVLVSLWGIAAAEHDRVERSRARALRHEARHAKGAE